MYTLARSNKENKCTCLSPAHHFGGGITAKPHRRIAIAKPPLLGFGSKKLFEIAKCKKVHKPSRTYPGEGGCPEMLKKSTYRTRF